MEHNVTTPEQIRDAHQYLYYVLNTPVWRDYDYDQFCHKHGLQGGGGSEYHSSYPPGTKELAILYLNSHVA